MLGHADWEAEKELIRHDRGAHSGIRWPSHSGLKFLHFPDRLLANSGEFEYEDAPRIRPDSRRGSKLPPKG